MAPLGSSDRLVLVMMALSSAVVTLVVFSSGLTEEVCDDVDDLVDDLVDDFVPPAFPPLLPKPMCVTIPVSVVAIGTYLPRGVLIKSLPKPPAGTT